MTSETKIPTRLARAQARQLAESADAEERRWANERLREENVRVARRLCRRGFIDHETYEDLLSEDWGD